MKSKKAFLALIITIIVVLVVGTVTTTYAWFLSRYSKDYTFVLESTSPVIIKYETDLNFASGNISTPGNILIPAKAKQTVGINQEALSPMDMFDTVNKVQIAAHDVKFSATGAYWTGEDPQVGKFKPELRAYLSSFVTAQSLSEDTLLVEILAGEKPINENDLVRRGEVDFFVIFEYLNQTILYYNNVFYVHTTSASDFTLPSSAESNNNLRYWTELTQSSKATYNQNEVSIYDGTYLLLQPNTAFTFDLYVFIAKTDEELDPIINGERISLFATLAVHE